MKKVMIIGKQLENFMLNAVIDTLKTEGYSVEYIQPNIDLICDISNMPSVMVIYGGKYIYECMEVFNFVGHYCSQNNIKIFIIGYANEIEKLKTVVPEHIVAGSFERPINTKAFVDMVNASLEVSRNEEPSKKHILVVDDSGTMLRTIKSWLSTDYNISMASSAAMASTFLKENTPDLILLDYAMPVCSGPEFLATLKSNPETSNIPVIFLTSMGDRESVTKVLEYRPAGYLLKTMPPDEIMDAIDNFFKK